MIWCTLICCVLCRDFAIFTHDTILQWHSEQWLTLGLFSGLSGWSLHVLFLIAQVLSWLSGNSKLLRCNCQHVCVVHLYISALW